MGETHCTICDADYRVDANGDCVPCGTGYTNEAGDDSDGGAETQCTCDANYYVDGNGDCVDCAAGKTNEAGDDPTGGAETECTATLCEANFRVDANNACVPCGTGYTNEAGDDASDAETQCTICDANYYVDANGDCVACADGHTNAAGDDSEGGAETQCTTCAANYYVDDNVCTVCATGKTHAAGDDATGDDTECTVITGYCDVGIEDEEFECGTGTYLVNVVEQSCAAAEDAPDGTTCTLVPATYLDIAQGIAANQGSCTSSSGDDNDCEYTGTETDCPEPAATAEDKSSGAISAGPVALVASLLVGAFA